MANKSKPKPPTLEVRRLGQILKGTVAFGDLTLLVGGQASGKSIFLQLLKLLIDRHQVFDNLQKHGYDWGGDLKRLLDLYFGESMSGLWHEATEILWNHTSYSLNKLADKRGAGAAGKEENVFYIPAQRVITMAQGWPRPFNAFEIGDPYVLKAFSETLRLLMEKESLGGKEAMAVFPREGRMKAPIRDAIAQSIFYGASIELDREALRKRFLLRVGSSRLPFMTWSAGQKEFMPLLLSLYHLTPPAKISTREKIEWVVIEEPEMGLHPQAIQTVMLLCLELLSRGYRVVITTHSPVFLELAWAIRCIQPKGQADALFRLFGLTRKDSALKEVFQTCLMEKTFKTYFFRRNEEGIHIQDISELDPGSDDPAMAHWGGLSEFASRAGEVVAQMAQQ